MARHNASSMSQDAPLAAAEPMGTDAEEAAVRWEQLQAQLKSSERLNEYYNQVVAELRASLERIEQEEQAS